MSSGGGGGGTLEASRLLLVASNGVAESLISLWIQRIGFAWTVRAGPRAGFETVSGVLVPLFARSSLWKHSAGSVSGFPLFPFIACSYVGWT